MEVTETKAEKLQRDYKVVVPADVIEKKLMNRLETLREKARMPGFRPGKVPVDLLRKIHGKNLMGEVLEEAVTETSQEALEENSVRPAMQPQIEITKFDDGEDLEYTMSVEMIPDIDLKDFGKIKLEKPVAPATDEQIDDFLQRLADQQKSFETVEDKSYAAKEGDAVKIDFVGRIDGEEFEGSRAEDYVLELGSQHFLEGFEEQLTGKKAGDKVDVEISFPDDYPSEEIAGKTAVFEVDVKEVQTPKKIEIDDELAKSVGLDSLETLKERAKEQIEEEHERLSRLYLKRKLLDKLAEEYDFDVPPGMLELEFEQIWQRFEQDLDQQKMTMADLEQSEDELKQEYRDIAERRVRLGLLLAEIGQKNDVEVRQDELNSLIAQEARKYPGQEKEVFEYFQNNPDAARQLQAPMFEEKVVDYLLEIAEVKTREVDRDELIRRIEESEEESPETTKPAAEKKKSGKTGGKKAAAKKASAADKKKTKKAAGGAARKAGAKKASASKKSSAKSSSGKKSSGKKSSGGKTSAAKKSGAKKS